MSEFEDNPGAVAVIGLSGRFPGAESIDELWCNLRNGVESLRTFTEQDLDTLGVPPETYNQPNYVRAAMVLENSDMFDAGFFGFSPREARIRDPQHRLFLECAWEAIENAGYNPDAFDGPIGVFGGCSPTYYGRAVPFDADPALVFEAYQREIGSQKDYLCTTASYKLGLRGPAVTIQTACSTSLVAVCMACQSLMTYQCDMALAGGASVNTRQRGGYFYQQGMVLSPDGHCRAFDEKANGTVLGQGTGVVLLKRLSEAIADRDTIHAVIRGFAVNNDGSDKVGYTAPSVDGQAEVIALAQAISGIPVDTISYIEAHGTGTSLGDPIEIAALRQAFQQDTDKTGYCAIGSIKTNVGHLDAAAGVAGLIKTVLMLKHREIPASLNFTKPNPEIDFAYSPFYVNNQLRAWDSDGTPLRAGISSFGIGGTNAHVVLQEAPAQQPLAPSRPRQLLMLSAKTEAALDAATSNLGKYLETTPTADLADVAFTLTVGRKAFSHRRFAVCATTANAAEAFCHPESHAVQSGQPPSIDPKVVFMFPGQGSQYVNMGKSFYKQEPLFRSLVDECSEMLASDLQLDLRQLLYPQNHELESAAEQLRMTRFQQPALFTIEYALARLWQEWGIQPAVLIGHSIGEYAAACLSGIFSLEDALKLVAARGRMMQQLPSGSMLSVRLPAEEVQPRLNGRHTLAAINAPSLCVVSGPNAEIEALQNHLEQDNVMCRLLHTSHAFHSSMMDTIVEPFAELVGSVQLCEPDIPLVSTVTGTWMSATEASDPTYWAQQLRKTVRFADGIETVLADSGCVLLEAGPRQACATFARQLLTDKATQFVISSLGNSADKHGEWEAILTAMGKLWLAGVAIDGEAFWGHERRYRVPLPTYPFQRQRYWEDPVATVSQMVPSTASPSNQELEVAPESVSVDSEEILGEAYPSSWSRCEVLLADAWKEVLGVNQIALTDNYFSDLGGDSLSILGVIEMIKSKTDLRLDPNIFLVNTLRQIAAHIGQQQPSDSPYAPEATAVQKDTVVATVNEPRAGVQPVYFGEGQSRLFGIYQPPQKPSGKQLGVLLCYPFGQEYMVSHWAFRRLAQMLSQAGYPTFRFDYFGTGDSAGESGEGTISDWTANVRDASEQLQHMSGTTQISIVGMRMGAAMAAEACARGLSVKDLILWEPVANGKQYLEELSRYAVVHNHPSSGKTDELVGFPIGQAMRSSIEDMNLLNLEIIGAEKAYLFAKNKDENISKLVGWLESIAVPCECVLTSTGDTSGETAATWEGEGDILEDGLLTIRVEVLSMLAALLEGGTK